ncbi:hypothetical protein CF54_18190 [Streptomyces sp. Tu 6176]|uniref:hypothetical protein n=1 Tax=Streptomyces sp. Tu 6176 TaxID=1470557 RepID=UPI000446EFEF|nr:hypothetical protein [Streptomyces sp. Tu 6176]EYT81668.1 hypothetical protein CF54_18190 [Streptomyces sp. Tu 6176]
MRDKQSPRLRSFMAAGAVVLATGTAVVAAGAPASAAVSVHRVQLCAKGSYDADITWSDGLRSTAVHRGKCETFNVWGTGGYTIGGFRDGGRAHFGIAKVSAPRGGWQATSPGRKYSAEGTTKAPRVVRWQ